MKIGVLSDTHGEILPTQQALRILKNHSVKLAIHCGDVGVEIIPLMQGFHTHFVHGNIDDPEELRRSITQPEHQYHEQFGTLQLEGRNVAFLHGDDVKLLRHTIHSGDWDLVCHGHTHALTNTFEGRTLVLNPGAIGRTNHRSVAVVDLPSLNVTIIPL